MRMILLFTATCLVGCGASTTTQNSGGNAEASSKLVGVWEGQEKPTLTVNGKEVEAKGEPITTRFEFRADGSLSLDPGLDFEMTGKWKTTKVDGNKWTLDVEINVPSGEFGVESKDGHAKTKENMKVEKEQDTITVEFESDDRIIVHSAKHPDQPMKLQRKK